MSPLKNVYTGLLLLILFSVNQSKLLGNTTFTVSGLRCEYLTNPLGIDTQEPRLTWLLNTSKGDIRQYAYQILVSTDSMSLLSGKADHFTSVKTVSDINLAFYKGKELQPFTKYYWRVDIWDKTGSKYPSQIASFETGMMGNPTLWKGFWISDNHDIHFKPAPYFRKKIELTKKIKSARAYIAVAGLYEFYINGEKVGNHRLDPMYTRFDRRTLYLTHDITALLKSGNNALGIILGNGWYNHQSTAVWNFHQAPWRARPTFCLNLHIIYEDGSAETIASGKDWKTSTGSIIFNSIYTAEHQDARLEQKGWNTPLFDDSKWDEVIYREAPSKNIVSQTLQPIRNVEKIPVKNFNKINDSTYLFDLGRNISGVSQLKIIGKSGTKLRLKHAERLNEKGKADLSNIDVHYRPTDDKDPFQTDIYILSGNGEETFSPHFNYKGFQYVEVTADKPISLTKESVTGYFMHSDLPVLGHIKSSNPIIDKIWLATNHSYLSNMVGYPTDCPQREKNGWTGDAHIAVETGLYNFEGITVYEKWLADHRDEQQPDGVLPSIIPTGGWGYEWGNGPDWTSTIAIIPWNIYLFYGDSKLLKDSYDNIKKYVNHIDEKSPSGLTSWGLGDWIPVKSKCPVELTSSIYYFTDVSILAKAAKLFNNQPDYEKYSALSEKIKNAINAKYLNETTGIYSEGTQTELSAPLYWKIVPEKLIGKVAANLAKRVQSDSIRLDVGLLGTKTILNALSENGYSDLAYQLASKETYPSWGWWMANGATTLYENWSIDSKSDVSMNHIMFGEIGGWFYKALAGIKPDPNHPGFKNILLEPHFVSGLSHFEAVYKSPYGEIKSSWSRTKTGVNYEIILPANSSATLKLPSGKEEYLKGGSYHFLVK